MPDLATALKEAIDRATNTTTKEKQMTDSHKAPTFFTPNADKELVQLANDWAKDDPTETISGGNVGVPGQKGFPIRNNVSRATFYCIKENPGHTQIEIARLLEKDGYKYASVATLISQMVRCGILRKDESKRFYVTQSHYTPVKESLVKLSRKQDKLMVKRQARAAKKAEKDAKTQAGLAALATKATPTPVPKPAPVTAPITTPIPVALNTFDVDKLLDTLTFAQTMALYKKLKTMFGEL